MGRKARLKREGHNNDYREQKRARRLIQEYERAGGPPLSACCGTVTADAHSSSAVTVPGDMYASTIRPASPTSGTDDPARRADEAAHRAMREREPVTFGGRRAMAELYAQGLMLLADAIGQEGVLRVRAHGWRTPPPDGRFTPKRRR